MQDLHYKVYGPYIAALLNWSGCMARFLDEYGYQKDKLCDEIGMCQNILTILVLIVNRNGEDICHHLKRKRIFLLAS